MCEQLNGLPYLLPVVVSSLLWSQNCIFLLLCCMSRPGQNMGTDFIKMFNEFQKKHQHCFMSVGPVVHRGPHLELQSCAWTRSPSPLLGLTAYINLFVYCKRCYEKPHYTFVTITFLTWKLAYVHIASFWKKREEFGILLILDHGAWVKINLLRDKY